MVSLLFRLVWKTTQQEGLGAHSVKAPTHLQDKSCICHKSCFSTNCSPRRNSRINRPVQKFQWIWLVWQNPCGVLLLADTNIELLSRYSDNIWNKRDNYNLLNFISWLIDVATIDHCYIQNTLPFHLTMKFKLYIY